MSLSPALAAALREALPPDQRQQLQPLLDLLGALAAGGTSPASDPSLLPAIQSIAGRPIGAEGSLVRFAEGAQLGDVTFSGPVAGGNVITVNVALPLPAVAAAELAAPHLFLCYSRADAAAADELARELRRRGLRVWRDVDSLHLGRPALRSIEQALASVAGVLLLLTPRSLASDFIRSVEIQAALRRARADDAFPVIPVLDGVSLAELEAFGRDQRLQPRLSDFQLFELPPPGDPARAAAMRAVARLALRSVLVPHLRASQRPAFTVELCSIAGAEYDYPADARVDWVDSTAGGSPTPESWRADLRPALEDLVQALREAGRRPIKLRPDGSRLAVALGFGYMFREVTGFHLWAEQRTGPVGLQWWRTDDLEVAPAPLAFTPVEHDPAGRDLTLEISMGQPVTETVRRWIESSGAPVERRLQLHHATGRVAGSAEALAIARQVQAVVDQARGRRLPDSIHLFAACPVALAALIGWHLNRRGPVVVYEYRAGAYVPAAVVGDD